MHIPLVTNENRFMIVDDQLHRLPAEEVYIIDTTKNHTRINASREDRIHIEMYILMLTAILLKLL